MKDKVYAQVYSLIRVESEGLIDTLNKLAAIGYDGVELIGANTEGLSVDEFVALLKKLNLKVAAVHGISSAKERAFAKAVGAGYVTTDAHFADYKRETIEAVAEELNAMGDELAKDGLKGIVHNHADEFMWIEGEEGKTRVYDVLLEKTNPATIGFEFDVGWGALAGADVVEYIRKYPGRYPMIHVKECTKVAQTHDELEHFPKSIFNEGLERDEDGHPIITDEIKAKLYETRNWNRGLGTGIIDWKALVEAADAQGCFAYISEREYYHFEGSDGTPECAAKLDYEYLRSL